MRLITVRMQHFVTARCLAVICTGGIHPGITTTYGTISDLRNVYGKLPRCRSSPPEGDECACLATYCPAPVRQQPPTRKGRAGVCCCPVAATIAGTLLSVEAWYGS